VVFVLKFIQNFVLVVSVVCQSSPFCETLYEIVRLTAMLFCLLQTYYRNDCLPVITNIPEDSNLQQNRREHLTSRELCTRCHISLSEPKKIKVGYGVTILSVCVCVCLLVCV